MNMKEYNNLFVEIENGTAVVTMNRPQALNALNDELMSEINDIFTDLNQDNNVKVIILTGAGEKSFVAGADIKEMKDLNAD